MLISDRIDFGREYLMTEHNIKNGPKYDFDNISVQNSEALDENEMFRLMQDESIINVLGGEEIQPLRVINSPGAAAAVIPKNEIKQNK